MTRRPTTHRPAAAMSAPGAETTSLLTEALATRSVTLGDRHEIAADLRERRLAARDRAARDHDEDAGDPAERSYHTDMAHLLMLQLRPTDGVGAWKPLNITSADPTMHTSWTDQEMKRDR